MKISLCTYVQLFLARRCIMTSHSGGKNAVVGTNSFRKINKGSCCSRHAEVDAMLHLQFRRGPLLTISLLVIRVNRHGELKSSRPCFDCLNRLRCLYKRGYNLCHIYYSDHDGTIVKAKFLDLLLDQQQHVTRGFRY